jgi:glycosyltransferase involved in cell wall biosynthesis
MQAMDVLATSSAWGEAFPNVLGEAMACGVPCVATDVGDSREIVGDSGLVVPPRDSEALADGLKTVIRKTVQERQALGRAARQRVQARYSLDSVVAQYVDLYQTLSERRAR